jgi:hypothetical protein
LSAARAESPAHYANTAKAIGGTLEHLRERLGAMAESAKTGIAVCNAALASGNPAYKDVFGTLSGIDKRIGASDSRDAVSLVFPTEAKLEAEFAALPRESDPNRANVRQSLVVYTHIERAAKACLAEIFRTKLPQAI